MMKRLLLIVLGWLLSAGCDPSIDNIEKANNASKISEGKRNQVDEQVNQLKGDVDRVDESKKLPGGTMLERIAFVSQLDLLDETKNDDARCSTAATLNAFLILGGDFEKVAENYGVGPELTYGNVHRVQEALYSQANWDKEPGIFSACTPRYDGAGNLVGWAIHPDDEYRYVVSSLGLNMCRIYGASEENPNFKKDAVLSALEVTEGVVFVVGVDEDTECEKFSPMKEQGNHYVAIVKTEDRFVAIDSYRTPGRTTLVELSEQEVEAHLFNTPNVIYCLSLGSLFHIANVSEDFRFKNHVRRYCNYLGGLGVGFVASHTYDYKFRQQLKGSIDKELRRLFVLRHLYRDLDTAMRDYEAGQIQIGKTDYRKMEVEEKKSARDRILRMLDDLEAYDPGDPEREIGHARARLERIQADGTDYSKAGAFGVRERRGEWEDDDREGRVVAWKMYRPTRIDRPVPCVIYSHGAGGNRDGNELLGQHLASHGIASIHLQHVGSDTVTLRRRPRSLGAMVNDPKVSADRFRDIAFALSKLKGLDDIDSEMVGVAGHSLGGLTAQVIAGQNVRGFDQTLAIPELKGAFVLSPSPPREGFGDIDDAFENMLIPMFHVTGGQDTPPDRSFRARDRKSPFERTSSVDQSLLVLKDGTHFTFSGNTELPRFMRLVPGMKEDPKLETHHFLIKGAALAFWKWRLLEDEDARNYLRGDGFRSDVGELGEYKFKPAENSSR